MIEGSGAGTLQPPSNYLLTLSEPCVDCEERSRNKSEVLWIRILSDQKIFGLDRS
jgi:hypothetical protein